MPLCFEGRLCEHSLPGRNATESDRYAEEVRQRRKIYERSTIEVVLSQYGSTYTVEDCRSK